jgi:hypothetical protein
VAIPNKTIAWAGALFALVVSGLIAFLVSEWMWVGIVLFLAAVLAIFVFSVGSEGVWKATCGAVKRLLTGW